MKQATALRANNSKLNTDIIFKDQEHEEFYDASLEKCRYQDSYHKALCYCLGISDDTRRNVNSIYDFKTGLTECSRYSVSDLFCCSYAKYFWQAIGLRYAEYVNYRSLEEMLYGQS